MHICAAHEINEKKKQNKTNTAHLILIFHFVKYLHGKELNNVHHYSS